MLNFQYYLNKNNSSFSQQIKDFYLRKKFPNISITSNINDVPSDIYISHSTILLVLLSFVAGYELKAILS